MQDESPRARLRRLGRENGRILLKVECNNVLRRLGEALDGPLDIVLAVMDDFIERRSPALQLAARRQHSSRILTRLAEEHSITIEGGKWRCIRTIEHEGSIFTIIPVQSMPAPLRDQIENGTYGEDLEDRLRAAMGSHMRASNAAVEKLKLVLPRILDASMVHHDGESRSRLLKMLRADPIVTNPSNLENAFRSLARDKGEVLMERIRKETLRRDLALHLAFDDLRTMHRAVPLSPRRIIAHIGPTNSGKTHQGMLALTNARTGIYLAPLRLMALEGRDRLASADILVDMMTGEDMQKVDGATHLSCTIEMLDVHKRYEVALIDEVQMLHDASRGWAWTRALVAVDADVVILAGSADALPMIRRIVGITGDDLEIHHHERRAPLHALQQDIDIDDVRPGDAIIAFSRGDVLDLKELLSKRHSVAAIYGALSPEVRNAEAGRFSRGEADVLVATDAIGMGLNLPIRRVLFSKMSKYDGRESRQINDTEIRQVGGRAGRMGDMTSGGVGTFRLSDDRSWSRRIAKALASVPTAPDDTRPYVWPTFARLETAMVSYGYDTLLNMLKAMEPALMGHPGIRCVIDRDAMSLVNMGQRAGLDARSQYGYLGCPLSLSGEGNAKMLERWMERHATGLQVPAPTFPSPPEGRREIIIDLSSAEQIVARATAYMWLARRNPQTYPESDIAIETRRSGNRRIETMLRARRIARKGGAKARR